MSHEETLQSHFKFSFASGTSNSPPGMKTPIVILGAGPGGLALGRLLELAEIPFIIFERDESAVGTAARQGGTLDIHADSGQIALQEAGLMDQFKAIARYDVPITIADKKGKIYVSLGDEVTDQSKPEIDRKDLRTLLLESISATRVHWGCQVREVQRDADGTMSVRFVNGRVESGFRLVVGADGARSEARSLVYSPV